MKKYLLPLLLTLIFSANIAFAQTNTFYEVENLTLSGKYFTISDKDMKYIKIKAKSEVNIKFNPQLTDGILWIKGIFSDIDKLEISINNNKIDIKHNTYYFKWVKLGKFDYTNEVLINIKNNGCDVRVDKIGILEEGLKAYDKEYAIDDIKTYFINGGVKVDFSGEDFGYGNNVVLYRKMTSQAYIEYLKKTLGALSDNEVLTKYSRQLLDFYLKPFEKVASIKVTNNRNKYSMYDNSPIDGYACQYYLKVENDFGRSIESKRVNIEYREQDRKIIVKEDTASLVKSYGYKDNANKIDFTNGYVEKTEIGNSLYLNKGESIKNIPSFLENSYYFKDVKDGENVNFNTNKTTEVFVYASDISKANKEYYYDKGYSLLKVPVNISSVNNTGFSYFFYKRYRKGCGDRIFVKNKDIVELKKEEPFSLVVEGNDLVIYYDEAKGLLANSSEISVKGLDKGNNNQIFTEKMEKVGTTLWSLRVELGAMLYQGVKLGFEFKNNANITDVNSNWEWDFYQYVANVDNRANNVVFFREITEELLDINFGGEMENFTYRDLEDYYVENGSIYGLKGSKNYGFSSGMDVKDRVTI